MSKLFVLCLPYLLTLAAAGSATPLTLPSQGPTRLRFFWHNRVGGPNATAVIVAKGSHTDLSPSRFGSVFVFDDSLTVGPKASSRMIGRAQGMYVAADQNGSGLLMVMTFAFSGARYNGSTLAVQGRNEVDLPLREMPIVGGSGAFRFATGYVQASPSSEDRVTGIFVVEYNCYISYTKPLPRDKRASPA